MTKMNGVIGGYKIYGVNKISLWECRDNDALFCDFELTGEVGYYQFGYLKLQDLITLLTRMVNTNVLHEVEEYEFSAAGILYRFKWRRKDFHLDLSISGNDVKILSIKQGTSDLYHFKKLLYENLMKELIGCEHYLMARRYGSSFFDPHQEIPYRFEIADCVMTVVNENVMTPRKGHVIYRSCHEKKRANYYQLMVNGKIHSKRYFEDDLKEI